MALSVSVSVQSSICLWPPWALGARTSSRVLPAPPERAAVLVATPLMARMHRVSFDGDGTSTMAPPFTSYHPPPHTHKHTPLMAVRTAVSGARASGEDISGLYAYHLEKTYTLVSRNLQVCLSLPLASFIRKAIPLLCDNGGELLSACLLLLWMSESRPTRSASILIVCSSER